MSVSFITDFGLPGVKQVPYGLHACQLCSETQQLIDAVAPYFSMGLRKNERCLWFTAERRDCEQARKALSLKWPECDEEIRTGRLRIFDSSQWFDGDADSTDSRIVRLWLDEERRALAAGYMGVRIAMNITSLEGDEAWATFMDYENRVTAACSERRIVALCSYVQSHWNVAQATEILRAHHCVLHQAEGAWEVLSSREDSISEGQ
jgi:hypothetical protein